MKAILMSIKPKYCELIASGKKTIEVRKSKPKLETPFKVYMYMTMNGVPKTVTQKDGKEVDISTAIPTIANGKVIGEFVCDSYDEFDISGQGVGIKRFRSLYETCLTVAEMRSYGQGRNMLYGWHISNLKIYDKPKELGEFNYFVDCENKPCFICKYSSRDCNGILECSKRIPHPPQSWMYVEELEEV